jgi:hypothetical protein
MNSMLMLMAQSSVKVFGINGLLAEPQQPNDRRHDCPATARAA